MRAAVTVLLQLTICVAGWAQEPKPAVDWTAIDQKLAAMNAAAQARDIEKAHAALQEASTAIFEEWRKVAPTPADMLRDVEGRVAANPASRAISTPFMARLACQSGQMEKAEQYAREALRTPSPTPVRAADAIHTGNNVLGLIALQRGDIGGARAYLLASTRTSGSQILNRWGPNLALAKALLEKGQNDAVLEYFELSRAFVRNNPKLFEWIATLKGGRGPDLSREYLWH
jgi:hypothetical protein